MAHLNLYVPDEIAEGLKREANAAKVPLSRYVLSLLERRETKGGWSPRYFEEACGFLREEMNEPADPLPEPVEGLELGK